jgi:hypothetical protein
MLSCGAGAALDPPLWIVPNKALSESLSLALSLSLSGSPQDSESWDVCLYYCRSYYKAACGGEGGSEVS